MENLEHRVRKEQALPAVKNPDKLRLQQAYYEKLKKSGVSIKQSYSVKSLSVI